jgi:WD40 repeat protein
VGTVPSHTAPTRPAPISGRRRRKRWAIALGSLPLIFALGVVIWINRTRFEVPEGSQVRVGEEGSVEITTPGRESTRPIEPSPPGQGEPASTPSQALTIGPPIQVEPVSIEIEREVLDLPEGAAVSNLALVTGPAKIEGLRSWTLETAGHRGAAAAAAYSPDGTLLATGCEDGAIRLWDPALGALVNILLGHDGGLSSLSWSPDGKYLASGSADGTVRLWDPHLALLLRTLGDHEDRVTCVAWTPDGSTLASSSADKTVRIWDAVAGRTKYVLKGHTEPVNAVAWSPDGKSVASAGADKIILLWDASTGQVRNTIGTEHVGTLAFSPDGAILASTIAKRRSNDSISLWNTTSGQCLGTLTKERDEGDTSVAFSLDGRRLLTGGAACDGCVRLWDLETREQLWKIRWLEGGNQEVKALTLGPDGRSYAAGSRAGTVQIGETTTGTKWRDLPRHVGPIAHIAFSPDGTMLATGMLPAAAQIWNVNDGTLQRSTDCGQGHGAINRVAWSPDGQSVALGHSVMGCSYRWDFLVGNIQVLPTGTSARIVWSPDGKTIAAGGAGNGLVDAATGELLAELPGWGWGLAFSPDSTTLARGGSTRSGRSSDVLLIALDSQQVIQTLSGSGCETCLAFSADGKSLAGGAYDDDWRGLVNVWDVDSGRLRAVLDEGHAKRVDFVGWSDDASLLFSGGPSELCVWDADSGKLLRTLPGDCIDISPDGTLIASRGASLIRLRRLDDGRPVLSLVGLNQQRYAALGPNGHYRASPRADDEFLYVALTDDGQQLTLTPDEFAEQYGWENEPGRVSGQSAVGSGQSAVGSGQWAVGSRQYRVKSTEYSVLSTQY